MKWKYIPLFVFGLVVFSACGEGDGSSSTSGSSISLDETLEDEGEGKSCLLGAWRPDFTDLALLQKESMGAESVTIRGNVVMRFVDEQNVETDVISMVTEAKFPEQPLTSVEVIGSTDAIYFTDDTQGTLEMSTVDFQYIARTEVLGETLEIPVNAADGLFGSVLGLYNCTGNTLIIQTGRPQTRIARLWHRVN